MKLLTAKYPSGRLPAISGQSTQTKTAPEGAVFDYLLYSYAVLRLTTPTRPIRPEPKSQTAAGTGTGDEPAN